MFRSNKERNKFSLKHPLGGKKLATGGIQTHQVDVSKKISFFLYIHYMFNKKSLTM